MILEGLMTGMEMHDSINRAMGNQSWRDNYPENKQNKQINRYIKILNFHIAMAMMMIQAFGVFQKICFIIDASRAPRETCSSDKDEGSIGFGLQAANLTSNFSFKKNRHETKFSKNASIPRISSVRLCHLPSSNLLRSYWTWPFSSLIYPLKMLIFHRNSWFTYIYLLQVVIFQFANC